MSGGVARVSGASLGQAAGEAIADGVGRFMRADPLSADADIETVHQARVATRRLRSDLRTFGGALDREWAGALREELRWLAALLGAARDADVLWQRLAERLGELDPQAAQGASRLVAAMARERGAAHAALEQALHSDRHQALVERLAAAARTPVWRSPEHTRPAGEALPRLTARRWRALERRVRALPHSPSDEELHAVRLAAKRCRYAAEACEPWLGKPARRLARSTRRIQEVLGELHDAVVAERWLERHAASARAAATARAARELAGAERGEAARRRAQWREEWRRAAAKAPPHTRAAHPRVEH
ncbi:MAG: CHAD domain-containing protein [Solirubrobacterales bacterium]|nr:CHAD domain-containing protein [Solirubrobacterales bacterium]